MEKNMAKENPLGYEKISKLILRYAIPAIIGIVVNSVYNLIDQVLIGWSDIGMLGIGATTVSYPLTTIMTALSLVLSIGASANFNLRLGKGDKDGAGRVTGNAISLGVILGFSLFAVALIFLRPMLILFGTTEGIMPYAIEYTRIIIFGIPFGIISTVLNQMIRADGSPRYSMICTLAGAVFNLIFDPLVLFVFKKGIQGIALTTSLGMVISAVMGAAYFVKSFTSVKLVRDHFRIRISEIKAIVSLGIAAFLNQMAGMIMQIVMNNTLKVYGALSIFGSDAAISSVGSLNKFNMIFLAVAVGVAQGCQPINGFNYGAKKYHRVKQTYKIAVISVSIFSTLVFLCYQIFPRQILSFFGDNPDAFFDFGERYLRVFLCMTFLNGLQPVTSNLFTSIGKATKGSFISLTRQIILLVPLLIILPRFFGVEGILFAGPVADFAAAAVGVLLIRNEMKKMTQLQSESL